MILIDAGPLVALADPLDAHHRQCVELATTLLNPQITTWPVLAEAAWIMRRSQHFFLRLLPSFADGEIAIHQAGSEALTWMVDFMDRYWNMRAQLADASLMYVAEREQIDTVFTLDRRDFSVYRTSKNRALKIVPE